ALFFNREAKAESVFTGIAQRYEKMGQMAETVSDQPTVFTGLNQSGTWYVPGGESYIAQYFEDAGAEYLWADNESRG
ncbi:ABC transporter substrate-binding protein, partial [Planococcus sp. SIMBA_160]